jgi:hypothetical protein
MIAFHSLTSTEYIRNVNYATRINIPRGYLHRATKTPVTSDVIAYELLEEHGIVNPVTGNKSIEFHSRLHWTETISRFQLSFWISVIVCTIDSMQAHTAFGWYAAFFVIVYIGTFVPEASEYLETESKRSKLKESIIEILREKEAKRLEMLIEKHGFDKAAILKELL